MMGQILFQVSKIEHLGTFLDALFPFFSPQYLLVPSLVILGALWYTGTAWVRRVILQVFFSLLISGAVLGVAEWVVDSPPPFMSGACRVFVNNTWHSVSPGARVPVPLEPIASFPFGASLAAVMLLGFMSIRRRTLWVMGPFNVCMVLAPIYCGWCWPGSTLAAWCIGAATIFVVRYFFGGGASVRSDENMLFLREQPRERRFFVLILVGWISLSFVNVYYLDYTHYDVQLDECQYWLWSRHLELCYYSKPPMIAYIDFVISHILGDTTSALRTGGVLCFAGTLVPVYALTRRISGSERAALIAAILIVATPAFSLWSPIMDTNKPAYPLWAAILYTAHCAFSGDRRMWAVTGFIMGMGLLTRFTFPFLAIALGLTVILYHPGYLKERGPYVCFFCALLCVVGLLYWEFTHDWISMEDVRSLGRQSWQEPTTIGGFFFIQMLYASPIIFVMFIVSLVVLAIKRFKDPTAGMLIIAFVVPLGLLLLLTRNCEIGPHWAHPDYLAAAVAAGWVLSGIRWRRLINALLIIGAFLGFAQGVVGNVFWPVLPGGQRMVGGQEIAALTQRFYDASDKNAPFIFSHQIDISAFVTFYTPGHPVVACCGDTIDCHDLCGWIDWDSLVGKDALFVIIGDAAKAKESIDQFVAKGAFTAGEYLETITIERWNRKYYDVSLVRFSNYSGRAMCEMLIPRIPAPDF